MFSPLLFSIAVVQVMSDTPDDALANVRKALAEVSTDSGGGYVFDFGAVAFANRHPDPAKDLLVEVQALSEEGRTKAIEVVTKIVNEKTGSFFEWDDVTEAALAYHLEQRAQTE